MRAVLFAFVICAGMAGCRSVKPPSPKPVAVLQAERLAAQAVRLGELQNWPAAAWEWQRAVDQYSLLNDSTHEAIALHNLAQAERKLGHLADAEAHLRQAARSNEHRGQTNEWWRNQIALLQIEAESHQTNQLETRMLSLLQQTNAIRDGVVRGLFLNELGLWQQRRGDPKEAENIFVAAEASFRSAGDRAGTAMAIANRARLLELQNQAAKAVGPWRLALAEFEKLGDPSGIASALLGLGRSLTKVSLSLPLAEDLLQRAAKNYRTLHRASEQQEALQALADCLRLQGKQSEALAVLQQAQQLNER